MSTFLHSDRTLFCLTVYCTLKNHTKFPETTKEIPGVQPHFQLKHLQKLHMKTVSQVK